MQNYFIFDKIILYMENILLLIYYIQPYQETISWSAFTLERRLERDVYKRQVQRLQSNLSVTTHTLDKLCKSLDCRLEDIAEYVPDDPK